MLGDDGASETELLWRPLVGRPDRGWGHHRACHQPGLRHRGAGGEQRRSRGPVGRGSYRSGHHCRPVQQWPASLLPRSPGTGRKGRCGGLGLGQFRSRPHCQECHDRDGRERGKGGGHHQGGAGRADVAALSAVWGRTRRRRRFPAPLCHYAPRGQGCPGAQGAGYRGGR